MTVSLQSFDSLRDAAASLGRERNACYVGGATLLAREVNEGSARFTRLVRCTDRALFAVRAAGSRVELGAGVTMSMVLANRELAFLHDAARAVGSPAVRAAATVGGNLFAHSPYGDFTTALLALDASVSVLSGYSPREIALEQFLADRERYAGTLIASVLLARPRRADALRFVKIARVHPRGHPVITIAAHLDDNAGRLSAVRIAYGAMGPTPLRVKSVERVLEGRRLDTLDMAELSRVASEGCAPATDSVATDWYRRQVAPVHLKRLLLGASASDARQGSYL